MAGKRGLTVQEVPILGGDAERMAAIVVDYEAVKDVLALLRSCGRGPRGALRPWLVTGPFEFRPVVGGGMEGFLAQAGLGPMVVPLAPVPGAAHWQAHLM